MPGEPWGVRTRDRRKRRKSWGDREREREREVLMDGFTRVHASAINLWHCLLECDVMLQTFVGLND